MWKIRAFYRRHRVGGPVSTVLLLFVVIERILNWVGLVDQVRSMMDPNHWLTKIILHPQLGLVISVSGLVLLLLLIVSEKPVAKAHEIPPAAPIPPTLPTPNITTKLVGSRIVVDVTPEYLTGLFSQHLNVQAKRLIEPYIGKWMKLSGPLGDVYFNQVTFAHSLFGRATVFMYPSEGFIDRCSVLLRGTHIEVIGRIKDVDVLAVHLENCELID